MTTITKAAGATEKRQRTRVRIPRSTHVAHAGLCLHSANFARAGMRLVADTLRGMRKEWPKEDGLANQRTSTLLLASCPCSQATR